MSAAKHVGLVVAAYGVAGVGVMMYARARAHRVAWSLQDAKVAALWPLTLVKLLGGVKSASTDFKTSSGVPLSVIDLQARAVAAGQRFAQGTGPVRLA